MNTKTIRVEHVRFPASKNPLADLGILHDIGEWRGDAADLLDNYDDALKVGGADLKKAARQLTHSFAFKFISAIMMNKRLPFRRRLSLVQLAGVAHNLHLEGVCKEPVPTYPKTKPNGDFRAISDFGPMHRTAQSVGRRMLERYVHIRPWQYDDQGVGAAVGAVCKTILAGRTAIVHVDVKAFYTSFDADALRKALPVPGRMVEYYLVARKMAVVPKGCPLDLQHDLLAKALSGVSHGSSVSPVIGAHTISKLNWHPGPDVTAAGYVDDLLIAAASSDVAATNAKIVRAELEALPTGHFVGVVKWKGDAAEGFTYLGHHIRLVGHKLEIHPAPGRWEELQEKVALECKHAQEIVLKAVMMEKPGDRRAAFQALCDAWELAESWLAAFSMCTDIAAYREKAMAPIIKALSYLGSDLTALSPYKTSGKNYGYSM